MDWYTAPLTEIIFFLLNCDRANGMLGKATARPFIPSRTDCLLMARRETDRQTVPKEKLMPSIAPKDEGATRQPHLNQFY